MWNCFVVTQNAHASVFIIPQILLLTFIFLTDVVYIMGLDFGVFRIKQVKCLHRIFSVEALAMAVFMCWT